MKHHTLTCILGLACTSTALAQTHPPLIPQPERLEWTQGQLDLTGTTIALYKLELREEAEFLQAGLRSVGIEADIEQVHRGMGKVIALGLAPNKGLKPEGYELTIVPEGVGLYGSDEAGVFRGIQTFLQLLPAPGTPSPAVPCAMISDQPRFAWRGMHLDVCRHFMPVDFIKKYIDLLARYKMNTFHWHLTDDQGWRVEIKRYPKLTEVGAWRMGSMVGHYRDRQYDTLHYGGFYTQQEVKDIVAYAAKRHIAVVPEIEMPGHAMAALAAYPELSCAGGPFNVERGWGVFDDVFCAGNDSVFAMMENVLTEVMALFPGQYLHIGGDECPKERWKTCPKCQARMKAKGLKDEHELQSYFIQRVEKFVNANGRKIIGWDEILEGGLAPNAAVMSWRGTEGGIAAAKQKHNVVMTPGSHCYFDHYQGDPAQEPLAIGGHTTVQKVYAFEPVPSELTAEEGQYILGAQGNLWTEYINTPEHAEYMAVPRMLALAEVLWSPKEKRNEKDFIARLLDEFPRLDAVGVNASKSIYQVEATIARGHEPGRLIVGLSSPLGLDLAYTVTRPPYTEQGRLGRYTQPLTIDADCEVQGWFMNEGTTGPIARKRFDFNWATAQTIACEPLPNERYDDGGPLTLVDGIHAGERRVNYEWLGWRSDVTITVHMSLGRMLTHVGIGALEEHSSWIHLPEQVVISTSLDGKTFTVQGTVKPEKDAQGNVHLGIDLKEVGAVAVRFEVKNTARIPAGMAGAGNPAWLFLDEIEVR